MPRQNRRERFWTPPAAAALRPRTGCPSQRHGWPRPVHPRSGTTLPRRQTNFQWSSTRSIAPAAAGVSICNRKRARGWKPLLRCILERLPRVSTEIPVSRCPNCHSQPGADTITYPRRDSRGIGRRNRNTAPQNSRTRCILDMKTAL